MSLNHEPAPCRLRSESWHKRSAQRSGAWTVKYECPSCGKTRQFIANMLGDRKPVCDGRVILPLTSAHEGI